MQLLGETFAISNRFEELPGISLACWNRERWDLGRLEVPQGTLLFSSWTDLNTPDYVAVNTFCSHISIFIKQHLFM